MSAVDTRLFRFHLPLSGVTVVLDPSLPVESTDPGRPGSVHSVMMPPSTEGRSLLVSQAAYDAMLQTAEALGLLEEVAR